MAIVSIGGKNYDTKTGKATGTKVSGYTGASAGISSSPSSTSTVSKATSGGSSGSQASTGNSSYNPYQVTAYTPSQAASLSKSTQTLGGSSGSQVSTQASTAPKTKSSGATNLSSYYSSQGRALPGISERANIYAQSGLGSAQSYIGSLAQNTALLNKLNGQTPANVEKVDNKQESSNNSNNIYTGPAGSTPANFYSTTPYGPQLPQQQPGLFGKIGNAISNAAGAVGNFLGINGNFTNQPAAISKAVGAFGNFIDNSVGHTPAGQTPAPYTAPSQFGLGTPGTPGYVPPAITPQPQKTYTSPDSAYWQQFAGIGGNESLIGDTNINGQGGITPPLQPVIQQLPNGGVSVYYPPTNQQNLQTTQQPVESAPGGFSPGVASSQFMSSSGGGTSGGVGGGGLPTGGYSSVGGGGYFTPSDGNVVQITPEQKRQQEEDSRNVLQQAGVPQLPQQNGFSQEQLFGQLAQPVATLGSTPLGPVYTPPGANTNLSTSGQYYKVGNDVFKSSDNAHVGQDDFQKLGLNIDLLPSKSSAPVTKTNPAPIVAGDLKQTEKPGPAATQQDYENYIEVTKNDPNTYVSSDAIAKYGPGGNQELSGSGRFYKVGNDIYDSMQQDADGGDHHVNEDEFHYLGLNYGILPSAQKRQIGDEPVIDVVDPVVAAQIAAQQKLLDNLAKQDPFATKTISQQRTDIENSLGRAAILAARNKAQKELDNAMYVYDVLAADIKEDPDFTKGLAQARLGFLDGKRQAEVTLLQRQLALYNNQLSDVDKQVSQYVQDQISQYTIYKDKRDEIQKAMDKIKDQETKEADAARSLLNSLYTHPEYAKNMTQTEISYILKNGTLPVSLIKKIGEATGNDYQNVVQTHPTATTMQLVGVTKDGKQVLIGGPVPDVSQSSGGGGGNTVNGQQYDNYKDIPQSNGDVVRQYIKDGNIIGSTTIPGGGTKLTPAQQKTAFVAWLGSDGVKGTMSKSTITDLASKYGVTLTSEVAGQYDRGAFSSEKAPTTTYDTYVAQIYGAQPTGNNAGVVILRSPQGQSYEYNTGDPEIQQALNAGYVQIQ